MFVPGFTGSLTSTSSPAISATWEGTTQSAPAGTGAPPEMRTASPQPTVDSGGRPAIAHPLIRSWTGAASVAAPMSAERAAKPSTSAEENGGMS
jgi:hypothetical protein